MKNYGIVLIRETGDTTSTHWKVCANSPEEAREILINFVKNDEGQKEFEKALDCGFPYRTNYVGFCDDYTENHCKEMTSENLRKEYQQYAWVCAHHEYYNNEWRDTALMQYCDKYGIQYKNRQFVIDNNKPVSMKVKKVLDNIRYYCNNFNRLLNNSSETQAYLQLNQIYGMIEVLSMLESVYVKYEFNGDKLKKITADFNNEVIYEKDIYQE